MELTVAHLLAWLQRPIGEWWLPIFAVEIVSTFVIFIAVAYWSSRRHRALGLELQSLPADYRTYGPIDFVPFLFSKIIGIAGAIIFLAGWLGGILAPHEWLGPASAPILLSIPVIWISFITRTLPLKCRHCGVLMKRFTQEETIGNGTIKTTIHHLCTHCGCATSEFTTD